MRPSSFEGGRRRASKDDDVLEISDTDSEDDEIYRLETYDRLYKKNLRVYHSREKSYYTSDFIKARTLNEMKRHVTNAKNA